MQPVFSTAFRPHGIYHAAAPNLPLSQSPSVQNGSATQVGFNYPLTSPIQPERMEGPSSQMGTSSFEPSALTGMPSQPASASSNAFCSHGICHAAAPNLPLSQSPSVQNGSATQVGFNYPLTSPIEPERMEGPSSQMGSSSVEPSALTGMPSQPASASSYAFRSHNAYYEPASHQRVIAPAPNLPPSQTPWIHYGSATQAGSGYPFTSAMEPRRMDGSSSQMDNSSFAPSAMASMPSQWIQTNEGVFQDWSCYSNESDPRKMHNAD